MLIGCDIPSCEMVSLTKFKLSLKAKYKKHTEIFIEEVGDSLLHCLGVETLVSHTGVSHGGDPARQGGL